jgi:hypothetical protein
MKRASWSVVVILLVMVPQLVAAQEIVVLNGGIAGTGGTTEVDIMSADDRLEVWVYEAYLSGRAGNAVDDYGQRVCRTPCHLTLANGQYTFYVGRVELGIDALGVPQGWEVEDSSIGSLIAGIIFNVIGGSLALTGVMALSLMDATDRGDLESIGWGTLIAGGVGLLIGIPLVATWKGEAIALRPREPSAADSLAGLFPGLALFPAEGGGAGWGLQLAGTWGGL